MAPHGARIEELSAELASMEYGPRVSAAELVAHLADASLWEGITARLRWLRENEQQLATSDKGDLGVSVVAMLLVTGILIAATLFAWRSGRWEVLGLAAMGWVAETCFCGYQYSDIRKRRVMQRLARERHALLSVVDCATTGMAVGAIAEALRHVDADSPAAEHLRALLRSVLPALSADEAADLSQVDLDSLVHVLPAPHEHDIDDERWALAGMVAEVLSHTDLEPAIRPLMVIADGQGWRTPPPSDVAGAARRAAERISARVEEERDLPLLLRASSPDEADTATLLRPASAGGEPQEQLLREVERGPDEPA
jgi:hypothetical protein